MPEQDSDGKRARKRALRCTVILALLLIAVPWLPMAQAGYYLGAVLLLLGIVGMAIPQTHLFHQQIFRLTAISGLVILLLSICYPISIGIIDRLRAAPSVVTSAEKPPARISVSLSNDPQSISIETTKGTRNK